MLTGNSGAAGFTCRDAAPARLENHAVSEGQSAGLGPAGFPNAERVSRESANTVARVTGKEGAPLVGALAKSREISCLPFLGEYRKMCIAPDPNFRRVLGEIRELQLDDCGSP